MYRIAQQFAIKQQAKAIITGESIGQVASQTLNNIFVLSSSIYYPILRPLVGLDKVEIENIARNIGTYKITAISTDGCTAVPKRPATRSKIKIIKKIEEDLGLPSMCSETADKVEVIAEW
jgi:thiamine biosynthesis protein ThiI